MPGTGGITTQVIARFAFRPKKDERQALMAKFSAVIPAYNRGKYIARAIESVLAQTVKDFEIIVVDDHSTDDTLLVAEKIAAEHPEVRVFRQSENCHGAQAARNRGWHEARGEWIAFLDSDDTWTPDHLEMISGMLSLFNWDEHIVVYTDGYKSGWESGNELGARLSTRHTYFDLLDAYGPMFQGLAVSRLALSEAGGLDEFTPSYQEWDAGLILGQECRLVHLCKPSFTYYNHADATISKDGARDVAGLAYRLQKYQADIQAEYGRAGVRKAQQSILEHCLRYGLQHNFEYYYRIFYNYDFNKSCALLVGSLREFISDKETVYLYGAGQVSEACIDFLSRHGEKINGCVVSDGQVYPSEVGNVPVFTLNQLNVQRNAGVIVAVLEQTQDDILTVLSERVGIKVFLISGEMFFLMKAHNIMYRKG